MRAPMPYRADQDGLDQQDEQDPTLNPDKANANDNGSSTPPAPKPYTPPTSTSSGAPTAPVVKQPTFSEMQANGEARPPAPESAAPVQAAPIVNNAPATEGPQAYQNWMNSRPDPGSDPADIADWRAQQPAGGAPIAPAPYSNGRISTDPKTPPANLDAILAAGRTAQPSPQDQAIQAKVLADRSANTRNMANAANLTIGSGGGTVNADGSFTADVPTADQTRMDANEERRAEFADRQNQDKVQAAMAAAQKASPLADGQGRSGAFNPVTNQVDLSTPAQYDAAKGTTTSAGVTTPVQTYQQGAPQANPTPPPPSVSASPAAALPPTTAGAPGMPAVYNPTTPPAVPAQPGSESAVPTPFKPAVNNAPSGETAVATPGKVTPNLPATVPGSTAATAPKPTTDPNQSGSVGVAKSQLGGATDNPSDVLKSLLTGVSGQGAGSAVADATQKKILDQLQNPNAYNSDAVKSAYDWMGGNIDDQYALQQKDLEEEMARRGLSTSTIGAGRLADLNIGRRSAKASMAQDLGQKMAESQNAATGQAISQGLGGAGSAQQNQQSWLRDLMGYGQQGFQNDMAVNQVNNEQNNQWQQFLMQMLAQGYGG